MNVQIPEKQVFGLVDRVDLTFYPLCLLIVMCLIFCELPLLFFGAARSE